MPWFHRFYTAQLSEEEEPTGVFLHLSQAWSPHAPRLNDRALDLLGVKYLVVNRQRGEYIEHLNARGYPIVFEDTEEKKWDAPS